MSGQIDNAWTTRRNHASQPKNHPALLFFQDLDAAQNQDRND